MDIYLYKKKNLKIYLVYNYSSDNDDCEILDVVDDEGYDDEGDGVVIVVVVDGDRDKLIEYSAFDHIIILSYYYR